MKLLRFIFFINLCIPLYIQSFDFIDATIEDFSQRMVPSEDRLAFNSFYQEFIAGLKKISPAKKNAELQHLRELARCSLEVKHPEWSMQLKPYAFYERDEGVGQESQLRSIRIFLTRYALYEEFLKNKALEHAGMWHKFKSYTKHVGSKMVNWFDSLRPSKKTA